jgi:hypothetical protein
MSFRESLFSIGILLKDAISLVTYLFNCDRGSSVNDDFIQFALCTTEQEHCWGHCPNTEVVIIQKQEVTTATNKKSDIMEYSVVTYT